VKRAAAKAGPFLKILFGAAILTWMATSGKLDLAQIGKALSRWPLMVGILALGYCQVGLMASRWRLLLRAQEILLSFRRAWDLTMIGFLFNVAIPGAVGGDLIKGYYITRASSGRKTHAAMTVVMDRVTGLIGLFFVGSVMALANLEETLRSPATRNLGAVTVAGFTGGMAFLYGAIYAGGRISQWKFVPRIGRTVFAALHEFRQQPAVAPQALALSVVNQVVTCALYYLAFRAVGIVDLPLARLLLIVPLGLAAGAIPLAPAGIGVGQAAFYALFQIVSPAHASAGAAAVTVAQAVSILLSLTGLFWYIPYQSGAISTTDAKASAT
jgi:glycosyltransferase 2 family protein